jgi:hypothetical protein
VSEQGFYISQNRTLTIAVLNLLRMTKSNEFQLALDTLLNLKIPIGMDIRIELMKLYEQSTPNASFTYSQFRLLLVSAAHLDSNSSCFKGLYILNPKILSQIDSTLLEDNSSFILHQEIFTILKKNTFLARKWQERMLKNFPREKVGALISLDQKGMFSQMMHLPLLMDNYKNHLTAFKNNYKSRVIPEIVLEGFIRLVASKGIDEDVQFVFNETKTLKNMHRVWVDATSSNPELCLDIIANLQKRNFPVMAAILENLHKLSSTRIFPKLDKILDTALDLDSASIIRKSQLEFILPSCSPVLFVKICKRLLRYGSVPSIELIRQFCKSSKNDRFVMQLSDLYSSNVIIGSHDDRSAVLDALLSAPDPSTKYQICLSWMKNQRIMPIRLLNLMAEIDNRSARELFDQARFIDPLFMPTRSVLERLCADDTSLYAQFDIIPNENLLPKYIRMLAKNQDYQKLIEIFAHYLDTTNQVNIKVFEAVIDSCSLTQLAIAQNAFKESMRMQLQISEECCFQLIHASIQAQDIESAFYFSSMLLSRSSTLLLSILEMLCKADLSKAYSFVEKLVNLDNATSEMFVVLGDNFLVQDLDLDPLRRLLYKRGGKCTMVTLGTISPELHVIFLKKIMYTKDEDAIMKYLREILTKQRGSVKCFQLLVAYAVLRNDKQFGLNILEIARSQEYINDSTNLEWENCIDKL